MLIRLPDYWECLRNLYTLKLKLDMLRTRLILNKQEQCLTKSPPEHSSGNEDLQLSWAGKMTMFL